MFFQVSAARQRWIRKFTSFREIVARGEDHSLATEAQCTPIVRLQRNTILMETTGEQSCDNVENGQDCSSCSYIDKQFVLPSKKRSANFFFDEGGSFPKYRKLAEEQIITTMEEEKAAPYAVSTSDISSDEFSNFEENNNGEKEISVSALNESSEACKFHCVNNDNMSVEEEYKCLDSASESDGSVNISPQLELPTLESVKNLIKEKPNFMQKFVFLSSTAKLYNSTIHTSQFSCNNEPVISEKDNVEVTDLPILQQSDSKTTKLNCVKDEICHGNNNKELTNISANEKIIPGTLETSDVQNFNAQYVDQENNMKDLLSNEQFTLIADTSDKNSSIIMKPNDIIINESGMQSGIRVENVNDMNSALPQDYVEENRISDKSSHFYSSANLQVTNTEDSIAEQNIHFETSGTSLDLMQLVLSLKQDIQELTKKIHKQENILDAIAHLNEINVAPLFSQSFPEKYNLKVPFNTIEEFDKFNQDLARDQKFCNEFITSLFSYIDNNVTLAKNIMTMMKIYMSKDLVTLYTASKATANKMVLKDTLFSKCLLQATRMTIRNGLLPLEHEKAFTKSLGTVVSGAKGWPTYEEEKK